MRVEHTHPVGPFLLSVLLALWLLASCGKCAAQSPGPDQVAGQAPVAQTTLVIFNDRPMPEGLWPALVAALSEELDSHSPETRVLVGDAPMQAAAQAAGASLPIQIVRGETIGPDGLRVNSPITVFLHGECNIMPRPRPAFYSAALASPGALGWVLSEHGKIERFAHVECARLADMLATHAFGLNREPRNQMMAVAIARVILHEWIHIATQNRHHSEQGLSKASFGVADLLAEPAKNSTHGSARLQGTREDSPARMFEMALENSRTRFPTQGCE